MVKDFKKSYQLLVERLEETAHLGSVMGIMHWDQEVIMPKGSTEARARQLAVLAGILHEKTTDPKIEELLNTLESNPEDCSEIERCNIRETRRHFDRHTKLPKSLVEEIAGTSSRGHQIWAKARAENKFEDFAPTLSRLVELKKEYARHIDPDLPAYDINMDDFERGFTMDKVDPIFDRLKQELIPLIRKIKESPYKPETDFLQGEFQIDRQEALGRRIAQDMGFDFDYGRMDVSVHPFCGGGDSTDVRITTRYRDDNFVESLYAVIHETGHGLYEQGRMADYRNLPVSEALSMGIHESQSLFWERMVAQQEGFCFHYLGLFNETFSNNFNEVSSRKFYEGINVSRPSFIRVEADEVTYPMHVILRYEIEKGLFDNSISVNDLPEIWNQKMEEYLGICPDTDTLGVLQDVHWSGGAFGYFPSYTLGAMFAAQFYHALQREHPEVEELISKGRFDTIKSWLNRKIHCKGKLLSSDELLKSVTGETLNPEIFLSYLKQKYATIYKLN